MKGALWLALALALLGAGIAGLLRLRAGQLDSSKRASEARELDVALHLEFLQRWTPEAGDGNLTAPQLEPAGAESVWNGLTDAQRQRVSENYRRLRAMSPEEQGKLFEKERSFRALPPERQLQLDH